MPEGPGYEFSAESGPRVGYAARPHESIGSGGFVVAQEELIEECFRPCGHAPVDQGAGLVVAACLSVEIHVDSSGFAHQEIARANVPLVFGDDRDIEVAIPAGRAGELPRNGTQRPQFFEPTLVGGELVA